MRCSDKSEGLGNYKIRIQWMWDTVERMDLKLIKLFFPDEGGRLINFC